MKQKLIQLNNSKAIITLDGVIAITKDDKGLICHYQDGNKVNIQYIPLPNSPCDILNNEDVLSMDEDINKIKDALTEYLSDQTIYDEKEKAFQKHLKECGLVETHTHESNIDTFEYRANK